jgi:hypothetical protein
MPWARDSGCGWTLRILRLFVPTSNEHPPAQNGHTVLVRRIATWRNRMSIALVVKTDRRPPSAGSMSLTTSIIFCRCGSGTRGKNVAAPTIDLSMSALQGQTFTQVPHDVHDESPAGASRSQTTRGGRFSQASERTSFTTRSWQASTHRPQRMHCDGS